MAAVTREFPRVHESPCSMPAARFIHQMLVLKGVGRCYPYMYLGRNKYRRTQANSRCMDTIGEGMENYRQRQTRLQIQARAEQTLQAKGKAESSRQIEKKTAAEGASEAK